MTDEDIRKLARYAAENLYKGYKEKNIALMEDEFKMVISFILKEYCIVEKGKIKALYSKMELDGNHVDSDNDWAVYEAMDELENIFGSELFNDTEK